MNFKKDYLSNMDSSYVPHYAISATTSIQTANQIAEATARLNAGGLGVDLSLINPELIEQIPREHFKEIDNLMKLTNAKATMHGPIVDLAGFTQNGWQEEARENAEKQVKFFIERAHDLDSKGNTPINFHINTQVPGEEWRKLSKDEYNKLSKEEKTNIKIELPGGRKKEIEVIREINPGEYAIKETMGVVNRETGQLNVMKREPKNYPEGKKVWTPDERLRNINETEWDKEKLQVFEYQRHKSQIEDRMLMLQNEISPYLNARQKGILSEEEKEFLDERLKEMNRLNSHIEEFDTHIHSTLNEVFNQLKYVPDEKKSETEKIVHEIQENYKDISNEIKPIVQKIDQYQKIEKRNSDQEAELVRLRQNLEILRDKQTRELQLKLNEVPTPELWTPSDKIAKEKTIETVSNVMVDSYKKFKENTPIMVLENYQPMFTIGKSEDIKDVVEKTRNKFAEKLSKEQSVSMDEAKNIAKKLIGVTWDVGHINFLRKHGYSEEDILKETKKIAPYVKQVHITDNFGFSDAHLPPGMGNAPIKEQLKILEKAGFKFEKGNVIVEAGSYVAQFKENPHVYGLEYFQSPLYTYKTPSSAPPYWKDIWEKEGAYGLGYGTILPEQHFQTFYGSGFSNLPTELGGTIVSDKSRFAGTPNQ